MKNPTSRLVRWALELQAHKGALNYVADAQWGSLEKKIQKSFLKPIFNEKKNFKRIL